MLTVEHPDGWLVIDELVEGFAWGGIRISARPARAEAAALARVMTAKNRVCGIEAGGAKAVVRALPRFVRDLAPMIERRYTPGPDLGTTTAAIEAACAGLVDGGRTAAARRAWGLSQRDEERLKRVASDGRFEELRTGWGAAAAIEELRAKTAVVHGFGNAGAGLARLLHATGVRIVGVADEKGGLVAKAGIDPEALTKGIIDRSRLPRGCEEVTHARLLETKADVLALAAVAVKDANRIGAKAVACVANLALTPAQSARLEKRGVVVLPDYLVNGGAVLAEYAVLRGLADDLASAERVVRERIGGAVRRVIAAAKKSGRSVRTESDALFGFPD